MNIEAIKEITNNPKYSPKEKYYHIIREMAYSDTAAIDVMKIIDLRMKEDKRCIQEANSVLSNSYISIYGNKSSYSEQNSVRDRLLGDDFLRNKFLKLYHLFPKKFFYHFKDDKMREDVKNFKE